KVIVDKSSEHLRDPEVALIVTKMGEQRVYIGGEVLRPGYVTLQPDMTLLQAGPQSGGFPKAAKLATRVLIAPAPPAKFQAARVDMEQVVESGVPERVRLHPNDVVYVPQTWIANMDQVVDEWVRGLIPSLPRVGAGYSLSNGI